MYHLTNLLRLAVETSVTADTHGVFDCTQSVFCERVYLEPRRVS